MDRLFLTHASTESVVLTILSFIISAYLINLKKKDKSTWMLFLFFFINGIFTLRNGLHNSLLDYNPLPITGIGMSLLFISLFFLIPFSLYFHEEMKKTTIRITILLNLIVLIGSIFAIVFITIKDPGIIFQFNTDQYFFKNSGKIIGIPATIFVFTPALILLVKTVQYSESKSNIFLKIIRPKGRYSKACRNFALMMFLQIYIAMLGVIAYMGFAPYSYIKITMINLTLILFFIITVTYLNNATQTSSFMIKITGITLVTILIILSALGSVFTMFKKKDYDHARLIEVKVIEGLVKKHQRKNKSIEYIIKDSLEVIPEKIKYIAVKPVKDGYYSDNYTMIYNRTSNIDNDTLKKSDQFLKEVEKKYSKRKYLKKSIIDKNGNDRKPNVKETEKMFLEYINKKEIPVNKRTGRSWDFKNISTYYNSYNFINGKTAYEVGYDYTDYRLILSNLSFRQLINIIILSLIVTILFPVFFRGVITTPLKKLLDGVRKVNEGDLNAEVAVKINDEIGYITNNFNNMVGSINRAQTELKNYSENLEDMVDDRTRELKSAMEELESTNEALIATKDELWGEMELARKIQTVLVPDEPTVNDYQISALMFTADKVGGDYYDVINIGGHDWIIIGDVSGHGVSAGLVMMMVQTSIQVVLKNSPDIHPSGLLESINSAITENIQKLGEDKYMTITVMACHKKGKFNFSGLHQDILIYRNESKEVDIIETDGAWIGIMEDLNGSVDDHDLTLQVNDIMLLFTDGVTEAWEKGSVKDIRDPETEMYGQDKLIQLFSKHGNDTTETIKKEILNSLDDYDISDDVTLVVMKRIK